MEAVNLLETSAGLPEAWRSRALGRVGTACVKVLRMDALPVTEESHPTTEALLVLDGRLELTVDARDFTLHSGELFLVPAGARHTVRPGSTGTLVIVETPED
ncbi:cupin domain-containing protein [Streptomyces sp. NPDC087440]|uniref:cupin domain-containing protein n=1 Tax=Streptomyces sp. NPDC087440 TaxID=3365790 RepID=UPI00381C6732